jgi:hypothetical protein
VRFFTASFESACAIGKERGGEREGGMKGRRKREKKLVSEKVGE